MRIYRTDEDGEISIQVNIRGGVRIRKYVISQKEE